MMTAGAGDQRRKNKLIDLSTKIDHGCGAAGSSVRRRPHRREKRQTNRRWRDLFKDALLIPLGSANSPIQLFW